MPKLKLVKSAKESNLTTSVDENILACPCVCHKSKLDKHNIKKATADDTHSAMVMICVHCINLNSDEYGSTFSQENEHAVSKLHAAETTHDNYLYHQSKTDGTVEANILHQDTAEASQDLGMAQAAGHGNNKQRPGLNFAGMDNDTSANPNQNEHVNDESRGATPENRPTQTPQLGHTAKPSSVPTPTPSPLGK